MNLPYENGTFLDPRQGSTYRAMMNLSPDGRKLEFRGYVGVALFGHSQTWNRLPDNATDAPAAATRPSRPVSSPAQKK